MEPQVGKAQITGSPDERLVTPRASRGRVKSKSPPLPSGDGKIGASSGSLTSKRSVMAPSLTPASMRRCFSYSARSSSTSPPSRAIVRLPRAVFGSFYRTPRAGASSTLRRIASVLSAAWKWDQRNAMISLRRAPVNAAVAMTGYSAVPRKPLASTINCSWSSTCSASLSLADGVGSILSRPDRF
jgi:hypothetical protein